MTLQRSQVNSFIVQNPESSRSTRYQGSCPACQHGTMMPLARFLVEDVNISPTADAIMPNRVGARFFPGLSLTIMLVSWFSNLIWGKAKLERGRAKVRKAREEILPRSPNSAICPNCYEVLERF